MTSNVAPVPVLTFTYSTVTGKVTFAFISVTAGYNQTITFNWTTFPLGLPAIFGCDGVTSTFSLTSAGVKVSAISPNSANVSPITSLSVRSSSLNQSSKYLERVGSNEWRQSTILLSVPVQVPPNSWIFYDNTEQVVRLQQQSIDTIDLYVTSTTFDPVFFNGVPWRIVLTIREKREEHDVAADNFILQSQRVGTQVGSKGLGQSLDIQPMKKPRFF